MGYTIVILHMGYTWGTWAAGLNGTAECHFGRHMCKCLGEEESDDNLLDIPESMSVHVCLCVEDRK